MSRLQVVGIDLGKVTSAKELHCLLRDALGFPDWYGCNWDAFWDAITGLVQMPRQLQISGWDAFSSRLPRDAELLQKCLAAMQVEYPQLAADVLFE
ncbi:barstar family protein [Pseudomonas sp. SBB6]|uniref:barstar family protein n=1 Tax=Pseudomonas sp. SBB6 TaxID=2962032 RepID=UPI0020B7CB3E|nr:barstar family protein [Pseudomonas sp. SBB6]MCP3751515.1 barstar family protein [Pseudomonas sp. SBB6]